MSIDTIRQSTISIGRDEERNDIVIPIESLLRGTYIAGLQGTGKTNLLKVIFRGIADAGAGGLFLDPHGDVSRELLATWPEKHIDRLVYLDASDPTHAFGLNLFDPRDDSPLSKQKAVDDVVAVFQKIYGPNEWGIQIETNLRGAAQIFVDNPGMTVADLRPFLLEEDFRRPLLARATTYPDTIDFWRRFGELSETMQKRDVASTDRRLMPLITHVLVRHMIGQQSPTVDFRELMDERKLVIVRLAKGEIGLEGLTLLSTLFVSEVLRAALSRSDTTQRPPFITIVDEFQTVAVSDFANLISEARKFNVGLLMANQYLGQLDTAQRAAAMTVINRIAFQVASRDARQLVDEGYFMAERKPGPPVRKPKIEEAFVPIEVEYWDPPEAEFELIEASAEVERLHADFMNGTYSQASDEVNFKISVIKAIMPFRVDDYKDGDIVPAVGPDWKNVADPHGHVGRQLWAALENPQWDTRKAKETLVLLDGSKAKIVARYGPTTIEINLDAVDTPYLTPDLSKGPYPQNDDQRQWVSWFTRELMQRAQAVRQTTTVVDFSRYYQLAVVELRGGAHVIRLVSRDFDLDHGDYMAIFERCSFTPEPGSLDDAYNFACKTYMDLRQQSIDGVTQYSRAMDEAQARVSRLFACRKTRIEKVGLGYDVVVKHPNLYTGRLETVYEWTEGELQSVTATKGELAQSLSHLPERQCVMRLRTEDGTLWQGMAWPHHDQAAVNSEQRTRTILERNRQQYYRPRAAVEVEINQRRAAALVVTRPQLMDTPPPSVLKRRKLNEV